MRFLAVLWLFSLARLARSLQWADIINLRDQDGIIEVTDANYQLLAKGPRDFYSVLYVTASQPNSQGEYCDLCDLFEANFRKVSLAMLSQLSEEVNQETFFFKLDVSHCRSFVQELGLKTIPHLLIYPPNPNNENFAWSKDQFYQFHVTRESVQDPVLFADFLAKILNVYIQVMRDFDITEFSYYFLAFLACFYVLKKKILPLIPDKSRFFSLFFSLALIFVSITGYSFTRMNNIPLIAKDEQGQIMYFSGGMGWQFGLEIFTISGMYLFLGSCTVGMIMLPRLNLSSNVFNAASIILLACGLYGFVYFTECFKIKQPGYPFAL
ncbi:LANO_0H12486g1_1 [Lachancea nothofagi CBS 11611]|uniref:LANO_0H12486g1_1 n=1 Tax=Lachancea nothofagi CBS 11611 TaxID=1266666 RepID=A0A1G4KMN0_9SACH|nr:LANO_0H12486g1_1 [Lachancea nothofagi CBS 11611]